MKKEKSLKPRRPYSKPLIDDESTVERYSLAACNKTTAEGIGGDDECNQDAQS